MNRLVREASRLDWMPSSIHPVCDVFLWPEAFIWESGRASILFDSLKNIDANFEFGIIRLLNCRRSSIGRAPAL